MNTLLNGLKNEFNWTYTENGAYTYKSTMDAVLDLFYHAPAKRGQDNTALFAKAYSEDALLAVKTAFYVRDMRGGAGERNTFSQMLRWLNVNRPAVFNAIIPLVPEYGRWKDVVEFVDNPFVVSVVQNQLLADIESDEGVSLLAKWMPSVNTSSKATRSLARKWMRALRIDERTYRQVLSSLRKRIGLVETAMSSREWGSIDYSRVPSRASLLYRKAFGKRDGTRYGEFLAAVQKGEAKINAAALFPYDLVTKYTQGMEYARGSNMLDPTVEAQWKALPNYAETDENILVVCDVSGSMFQGKPQAIDISVSLAIYAAERNKGAFANNFVTFSAQPQLITLSANASLLDKVRQVFGAGVGYDTNIQAVFDLLLRVAKANRVPQSEMPRKIVVISDMEFNSPEAFGKVTNYDVIKRKFDAAGYDMPVVVFWNVNSRAPQSPATATQTGVFLFSGASPSNFKQIAGAKATTPLEMMLEVIHGTRYAPVEEALKIAGL